MGEDLLFWVDVIRQNGRAWISSEPLYHYILYSTSLYHSRTYEKSYMEFANSRKMEELCSAYPSAHDAIVRRTVDFALRALSYDRLDAQADETIAYIRAQKRWKIYCSDKLLTRNRRIQALLIGIHPKLYKAVRKVYKRIKIQS